MERSLLYDVPQDQHACGSTVREARDFRETERQCAVSGEVSRDQLEILVRELRDEPLLFFGSGQWAFEQFIDGIHEQVLAGREDAIHRKDGIDVHLLFRRKLLISGLIEIIQGDLGRSGSLERRSLGLRFRFRLQLLGEGIELELDGIQLIVQSGVHAFVHADRTGAEPVAYLPAELMIEQSQVGSEQENDEKPEDSGPEDLFHAWKVKDKTLTL